MLFWRHIIGQEEVKTNPQKVTAVKEWRVPKTMKAVRSFFSFYTYYRRFVPGLWLATTTDQWQASSYYTTDKWSWNTHTHKQTYSTYNTQTYILMLGHLWLVLAGSQSQTPPSQNAGPLCESLWAVFRITLGPADIQIFSTFVSVAGFTHVAISSSSKPKLSSVPLQVKSSVPTYATFIIFLGTYASLTNVFLILRL